MAGTAAQSSVGFMNGTQNTRHDCQVLVVGVGPTGLVLAADLLARGISTRIIDKGDGVNLETRAVVIHARAMEVLDLMGLAERFVEVGQAVRWFSFYTDGRHRLSLDLARNGTRFPFMLDIAQHETEALLRARVAELRGVIEPGAELTGLSDEADGVTASVRAADGRTRTITAGYLVGCDGAHSRVRHELGLEFRGHPYPQDWLLAESGWTGPARRTKCTPSSRAAEDPWSPSRCAGTGGGWCCRSRATGPGALRTWPRSSGWPTSGRRSRSPCPIPPA